MVTSVLIEANPAACRLLFQSDRPGAVKLCTGVSADYKQLEFENGRYSSTFHAVSAESLKYATGPKRPRHQVPSAPLGQLLRMAGIAYLDLFSLDVEGSEAKVLATMDWTIPVRVWCIEWNELYTPTSVNASIASIMSSHGYVRVPWAHERDSGASTQQNQLWTWTGPWLPQNYKWRQWSRTP